VTARGAFALILLVVVATVGYLLWPRLEGRPPVINDVPAIALGAGGRLVTIEVADPDSGLRSFEARLRHAGGTATLASNSYPGSLVTGGPRNVQLIELQLDPKLLELSDGSASIMITARDWSLRDGLSGNRSELVVSVEIDTRAPRISVESGLTYLSRGGSAVAVYRLDEKAELDGVEVGDAFFRGYPLGGDETKRVAFFAIPVHSEAGPPVNVVAVDAASNRSSTAFPARVLERRFTDTRITLSPRFLERVAIPLAESFGFDSSDPVVAFTRVNEEGRQSTEERIREIVAASGSERLWSGAFRQLVGSKVTSQFAESRSYIAGGRKVSAATHYGFDLASTARDAITASNSGSVLFAGALGIYGDTVLVDHGQGIVSLYAHLSQIDVSEGDAVQTGQRLGMSGATGLAGGDHLHFAILIGATYVDPLEWWDPSWVRSHVEVRFPATGG
jgi:murein DD-endopeptidase MepM/ murein hydrolase activator NlpD